MTIGIPRALLYYRYGVLWETFFRALGCEVVLSGETTAGTLENGLRFSIDESCVPAKIFMGHVFELVGQCDRILVPRIERFSARDEVCVKFWALPDIVGNAFPEARLICYNIDAGRGGSERQGFLGMGKELGKSRGEALAAFEKAKRAQELADAENCRVQRRALEGEGLKLLLVTHPYNIRDRLLGETIVKTIEALGGCVVFADGLDKGDCCARAGEISEHLYWTFSRELVGAIGLCRGRIDGIVLITAFPCGPDSLVNELILRRVRDIPTAQIALDEQSGAAGLVTRLESFMDILAAKRQG